MQNYLQKIQAYSVLCRGKCRSCSQQVLPTILRSLNTCTALCYAFLKKDFCYQIVLLQVNMRYLYEYQDSNGQCKFIDISISKITEDHSVAASQTKNAHIQLYLVIVKVKKNFLYEIVHCGQINKDQVDGFVQCTKFFIRTNHKRQETKVLELLSTQKH